ncbi:hypothetical protein [Lignipirellula cremea]|uniref:Uncharacterized protein n=1 Tax=Lignipirellula cremea TaxID=2528010 RepID=A0A518E221_9BACT|nr:hypothetical protein [Lignipirellula cremea]QDU98138.1 hypothetical protein Pla8534_59990 [Lignipirellula cremea]
MSASSKTLPCVGFMTVVDRGDQGLFGGYLVVNVSGRPLEFHCTAPVKANRAQQILYGPTLAPYLYGEQIGRTLISTAKVKPLFVCVDQTASLTAATEIEHPVVWIQLRTDCLPDPQLTEFELDGYAAGIATPALQQEVTSLWQPHQGRLDFREPFSRIKEALEEAHSGGKAA